MTHHEQHDEELREAQEGKGYGEDEGERDDALDSGQPADEPETD